MRRRARSAARLALSQETRSMRDVLLMWWILFPMLAVALVAAVLVAAR